MVEHLECGEREHRALLFFGHSSDLRRIPRRPGAWEQLVLHCNDLRHGVHGRDPTVVRPPPESFSFVLRGEEDRRSGGGSREVGVGQRLTGDGQYANRASEKSVRPRMSPASYALGLICVAMSLRIIGARTSATTYKHTHTLVSTRPQTNQNPTTQPKEERKERNTHKQPRPRPSPSRPRPRGSARAAASPGARAPRETPSGDQSTEIVRARRFPRPLACCYTPLTVSLPYHRSH
ncbi:hypothetical protein NUW54_g14635 [Trametes sanguinea]|uniref:Uncharacterized protein n=1 Tax=Trametes sanguinea TaxID=158606 RepID=A0ACC1MD57_9APHY|nr:hypothetical protein NUW54_g14635 [Trametes sanguinea]